MDPPKVVARLREAGCVFAEDEARILMEAAQGSVSDQESSLTELIARRVAGEPLEQIVGWVEFAGQRLHVVPGVFVPRQRTALLAERSILAVQAATDTVQTTGSAVQAANAVRDVTDATENGRPARFLEAFCGVGAVATTVASAIPGTQIHLGDHDETALRWAQDNVGPCAQAHLLDCLVGLPQALSGSFDVISAVPPYVPDSAAQFLPREASEHEPATALFGGVDGLDLVRRLVSESREWLVPGGVVLIELGVAQYTNAAEFAEAQGFTATSTLGEDEQSVVLELQLNERRNPMNDKNRWPEVARSCTDARRRHFWPAVVG